MAGMPSAEKMLFKTSCAESNSKPAKPSILPSTRQTFQAGRVSPKGRTTAWKLWMRPSAFTNVPGVSVNGAMGSRTSAQSRLALNGLSDTTIWALAIWATAFAPPALSCPGSTCIRKTAFKPPANMAAASMPSVCGIAPTNWAPTVFAASPK